MHHARKTDVWLFKTKIVLSLQMPAIQWHFIEFHRREDSEKDPFVLAMVIAGEDDEILGQVNRRDEAFIGMIIDAKPALSTRNYTPKHEIISWPC